MRVLAAAVALAIVVAGCGGPSAGDGGSAGTAAQDEYIAWMRGYIELDGLEERAIERGARAARLVAQAARPGAVLDPAGDAEVAFARLAERASTTLPRPEDHRVARLDREYRRGVDTMEAAMGALVDAIGAAPGERAARLVDRYGRLRERGVELLVQAGTRTATLYEQLGGGPELGGRITPEEIRRRAQPDE